MIGSMSIDRGMPTPPGAGSGFELVPPSGRSLLAFLRTNGDRLLGRQLALADEVLPVERELLGQNAHVASLSPDVIRPLTHDVIHISAFVLAHERLMRVAPGDVSPTLVQDVLYAVHSGGEIDATLPVQLSQFADSFERDKEKIRQAGITFTDDQQLVMMAKALDILPIATREITSDRGILGAAAVIAAFRAIDEGFNDNGAAVGAFPIVPPKTDRTGVALPLPEPEPDEDERLVGAGPRTRRR